jgi:hypothetical protein
MSGSDGTTGTTTLQVSGINLAGSQNTNTCGGTRNSCTATNQFMFASADMAGNVANSGRWAVLIDTSTQFAISTPTFPTGSINLNPNFTWIGPSTTTINALGAGAQYLLQVSQNASMSSPVLSMAVPALVVSTNVASGSGAYISTYSLTAGTYYWRVAAINSATLQQSPWSSTATFTYDTVAPAGGASFATISSTGGAIGEGQFTTVVNVTAQASITDTAGTGLTISTYALATAGDGHDGPGASSGYGVMYSTTGGANWIDSLSMTTFLGTGLVTYNTRALAVYGNKLYSGDWSDGSIHAYNGTAWSWVGTPGGGVGGMAVYNGKLYLALATGNVHSYDPVFGLSAPTTIAATTFRSLAVFNGKLYAGGTNGKVYMSDGVNWSTGATLSPGISINALTPYNGQLYAADGTNGKVYSTSNGVTWVSAQLGTGVNALAVFNGKLYAADNNNRVYSFNGTGWNGGIFVTFGNMITLQPFNGKLYGSDSGGKIFSTPDGVKWVKMFDYASVAGGGAEYALGVYNGNLYAGDGTNGNIYKFAPITASMSGSDGTTSAALQATGLVLGGSQNVNTCGGAGNFSCTATNQVVITASDLAGNSLTFGPYAVLVDSITSVALSSPTYPIGPINFSQPNFTWAGPADNIIVALSSGNYILQVANSATFNAGSIVISISTPARVANATSDPGMGVYFSTYTLSAGTYYWRVSAVSGVGGLQSPWSATASFTVDPTAPSLTAFQTTNSTGGIITEAQWNNSATGLTASMTASEVGAGFAVSTGSLLSAGDGKEGPSASAGFGVIYSTNTGSTWNAFVSTVASVPGTTPTWGLGSLVVFDGKIFAGGTLSGIYSSVDGINWDFEDSPGDGRAYSMVVYNGNLYAANNFSRNIRMRTPGAANWTNVFTAPAQGLTAMGVFNGRVYAASTNWGAVPTVFSSGDGLNWRVSTSTLLGVGGDGFTTMAAFQGKLYVGSSWGVLTTSDDVNWVKNSLTTITRGATVFNGKLYMGEIYGGIYSTPDGNTWTKQVTLPINVMSLMSFNGRLYAAGAPGVIWSSADGTNWVPVFTQDQGYTIAALAGFKGKLHAAISNTSEVYQLNPVSAVLTGGDGATGSQIVSLSGLNLIQSTNSSVCAGSAPCNATNQIVFSVGDLAGNVTSSGLRSVLIDTVTPFAISTPTYPVGPVNIASLQPVFNWMGPTKAAIQGLSGGSYILQAATDPGFSNAVISISTPAVLQSTAQPVGVGAYVSTYTLTPGTYYWRVAAVNPKSGLRSPWSSTATFTLDATPPNVDGFQTLNSTSGALGESQWNDKISGVTAQVTVSDALTGLAISTVSMVSQGFLYYGTSSGYGVMYSTNGGQSWVTASTISYWNTGAGAQSVALASFAGKLYAGYSIASNDIYSSVDGRNWSSMAGPLGQWMQSFFPFNGSLYSLDILGAQLYSLAPQAGSNWTVKASLGVANGFVSLATVHSGYLYATSGNISRSPDGINWTATGAYYGIPLTVYNGYLYGTNGTNTSFIRSLDGTNWTAVSNQANNYLAGMGSYNGRLFAGENSFIWSTADGVNWSQSNPGYGLNTNITKFFSFNGMCYGQPWDGRYPNLISPDGVNWVTASASVGGNAMASYNGKLYEMDTNSNVAEITPLPATMTGTDGTTSSQTLTATGFNFVTSKNAATCAGAQICTATNQVRFSVTDMAGNVMSKTFAVLVDTVTPAAISTPTYPVGSINVNPNFTWIGPSSATVLGLAGGKYLLQVSGNSNMTNPLISVSVPAVVVSTSLNSGFGVYLSTYTLSPGTYYWRVAATNNFTGLQSPWSSISTFTYDAAAPSASAFTTFSSTGGALAETQWSDVTAGGSAQATVSDALTGLAVSTSAPLLASGYGAGGYGVMYTTTSGANWIDASTVATVANLGYQLDALAVFKDKLYAGGYCSIRSSSDGINWSASLYPSCIQNMIVFKGRLFTAESGGGISSSPDGTTWSGAYAEPGGGSFSGLAVYNGRIFAADYINGKVFSSADGVNWAAKTVAPGIANLANYNGKLYATSFNDSNIYISTDGFSWSTVASGSHIAVAISAVNGKLFGAVGDSIYAWNGTTWGAGMVVGVNMLAVSFFNGKYYSLDQVSGKLYSSPDAVHWLSEGVVGRSPSILMPFKGSLFAVDTTASGGGSGNIYAVAPLNAALNPGGLDGTTLTQTLSATSLNFASSVGPTTCGGTFPCLATNQIVFTASDLAGNSVSYGPYAVLVDTLTSTAVSSPTYPTGLINVSPNFDWVGPSTGVITSLGGGAQYFLQVSNNDPAFSAGNIAISVNVPAVIESTSLPNGTGVYVSTYTLSAGTYYWRVAAYNGLTGLQSGWSATANFKLDATAPGLSAFQSQSSTGGAIGENQWNNNAVGVTAQTTASDSGTGLALSTFSIALNNRPFGLSSGYGVMYSTTAGQTWAAALSVNTNTDPGGAVLGLSVFKDLLISFTYGAVNWSTDGITWTAGTGSIGGTPGPTAVFNGKLYSADAGGNSISATSNGKSWTSSSPNLGGGLRSLVAFNGKLYGSNFKGNHVYASADGANWTSVVVTAGAQIGTMLVYNGLLYATDVANGQVYRSSNGTTWSSVTLAAGTAITSLTVFNKKLYAIGGVTGAGGPSTTIYSTSNGTTWTSVGAAPGGGSVVLSSLYAFNGMLYAGQSSGNGALYVSPDGGANWMTIPLSAANYTDSLAAYEGKLYVGAADLNNVVYELTPLPAALTGADGTTSAQTLSIAGMNLNSSQNTSVCAGVTAGCAASNQVIFTVSDEAGNAFNSGARAVLVDTLTPVAVSTPTYPANSAYVATLKPNYLWQGPSSATLVGLGGVPTYNLQVSNNDPTFATTVINITTRATLGANQFSPYGAYTAGVALQNATTYYWRVSLNNTVLQNQSPWSAVYRFVTDVTAPSASGFVVLSTAGSTLTENQWVNLGVGATVQTTVTDALSGLAVSNSALQIEGDGHSSPRSVAGYAVVYSSNAGRTWVVFSSAAVRQTYPGSVFSLTEYNGRLYSGYNKPSGNNVSATSDGISWSTAGVRVDAAPAALVPFNGALVAGAASIGLNNFYATTDGATWTPTPAFLSNNGAMAVLGKRIFAGDDGGNIAASDDGVNWTGILANLNNAPVKSMIGFNGALYAGIVNGGVGNPNLYVSVDGVSWSPAGGVGAGSYEFPVGAGAQGSNVLALARYGSSLYAGDDLGNIYSSPDGAVWTRRLTGSTLGITAVNALASVNGLLFAGVHSSANNARLYASADGGATWMLAAGDTGTDFKTLAGFRGHLFAGTSGGRVYDFTTTSASVTGSDGTRAAQTLAGVLAAPLGASTSVATCGGAYPCSATNLVLETQSDEAGNVVSYGPYAVLVDSVPPLVNMTGVIAGPSSIVATATGTEIGLSGLNGFIFEASSAPVFVSSISLVLTSGVLANGTTTYQFTSLLAATTYYVRVTARDVAGNYSVPSPALSTTTVGAVLFARTDVAPLTVLQGGEAAQMSLTLQTQAGATGAVFSSIKVRQTGSALDSDVAAVELYLSASNSTVFAPGVDALQATAPLVNGVATLALGGNSKTLTPTPLYFFIVMKPAAAATVGATLGTNVTLAGDIAVSKPFGVSGTFPATTSLTTIADGANNLLVTPSNVAPSTLPPGSSFAFMKFVMRTDQGSSILKSLHFTMTGNAPFNDIAGVTIYRDTNNNGTYDAADTLITSGADSFVAGSSTLNFTAGASSRTVGATPSAFFAVANLSAGANPGDAFQIGVDSGSDLALFTSPEDTVVFSTYPFYTSTVTVLTNNVIGVALTSSTPASYTQGTSYAVAKATLSVSVGVTQLSSLRVDRTGVGSDSDVSSVSVYQKAVLDGQAFNSAVDILLGSAVFGGGTASVSLSSVTLTAGTTSVLFIVYNVSPTAVPGDTLGAKLGNTGYVSPVSGFSSVAGNFPFQTATPPIAVTVDTLQVVSADVTVPATLLQGATNVALLSLSVSAAPNPITWSGLTIQRTGAGVDADVASVRVFRAPNGVLDSSATLVTTGVDTLASGLANMAFTSPQSIGTSTITYIVAVNIAAAATPGNQLGVSISTTSRFNINTPNIVAKNPPVFPLTAGPNPIQQYPNIVTVSTASLTPIGGVNPGATNVPMMKLTLVTDVSSVQWLRLKLDRAGASTDADIKSVKVYYDINNLGTFNSGNLAQYLLLAPSTITFGGQGSQGSLTIAFNTPQGLNATPRNYFVVVDVSSSAVPGNTIVVRGIDNTYFSVNNPNTVAATSFASNALSIIAPPAAMNILAYSSAPTAAVQGTSNIPMLSLAVWMSGYTGQWSSLALQRSGTGSDSDLGRIKLYRDDVGSGVLVPFADTVIASGTFSGGTLTLTFPAETLTVSTRTYFLTYDVAPTAGAGNTLGALIQTPGSFSIATPNSVSPSGFPIQSGDLRVVATQNGVFVAFQDKTPGQLLQGSTAQLMMSLTMNTTSNAVLLTGLNLQQTGTAPDSALTRLRLYYDSAATGVFDPAVDPVVIDVNNPFVNGTAILSFSSQQPVSTTNRRYFVALDVAAFADFTKTIGVSLASATALTVPAPNYVVDSGFPMNSSVVPIVKVPEALNISISSLLLSDVIQGSEDAVAKLTVNATRNRVSWDRLQVDRIGTLVDAAITTVMLYRDVNNDSAVGAGDLVIGSATFSGGTTTIYFSSAQTVGVSTVGYILAYTLDVNATIGATLGGAVVNSGYFHISSPDSALSTSLPFQTALVKVLDSKTPTQPVVLIADGSFTSAFDSLKFSWTSSVALGTIVGAQYAIGTTPGGTDVVPYTGMSPAPGTLTATGLILTNGSTYYVSARAVSSFGFTSTVGTSPSVIVDSVVPGKTPLPTVQLGNSSILLSWAPATAGASGIKGYIFEYRTGLSPQWFNIKTNATTVVAGVETRQASVSSGFSTKPADLVSPPYAASHLPSGTLYLRVRAVSNAGLIGDPSDEVELQNGALPTEPLSQVSSYPNPFDSRTGVATIVYTLNAAGALSVDIYSIWGSKVKSLSASGGPGTNTLTWDGTDSSGSKVAKGLYIAIFKANGGSVTYKIGVIH